MPNGWGNESRYAQTPLCCPQRVLGVKRWASLPPLHGVPTGSTYNFQPVLSAASLRAEVRAHPCSPP
jgi:hypothetical protein